MSLRGRCSPAQSNLLIPEKLLSAKRRLLRLNGLAMTHKIKKTRTKSVSFRLLLSHVFPVDQPPLPGVDRNLCAVGEMQFAQDVAHVPLDRVLADDQLLGDLAVRHAVGDQAQDVQLAFGQFGEER